MNIIFFIIKKTIYRYLIAAYGIKYPERVSGLVFVEPWGFPENPNLNKAKLYYRCVRKTHVSIPSTFIRMTGKLGLGFFKKIRAELKDNYSDVLPDPDLVLKYVYSLTCLPSPR